MRLLTRAARDGARLRPGREGGARSCRGPEIAASFLRSVLPPRVDDRHGGILEIRLVAGDEDQAVDDGGRGDQPIRIAARPKRCEASPFERDPVADRKNAVGELPPERFEPYGQMTRCGPIRA